MYIVNTVFIANNNNNKISHVYIKKPCKLLRDKLASTNLMFLEPKTLQLEPNIKGYIVRQDLILSGVGAPDASVFAGVCN